MGAEKSTMLTIDESVGGFHFRSIESGDKHLFMSVRRETSDMAIAYKQFPDFIDFSWEQTLNDPDERSLMVFSEPDQKFVAICSFQGVRSDSVDLGYDVVAESRGLGIGTKVVKALVGLAHIHFPGRTILIKVRETNIASQRVAEKCGGEYIGTTDTPEAIAIQGILEKNRAAGVGAGQDAKALEDAIKQGKGAVRIYRV